MGGAVLLGTGTLTSVGAAADIEVSQGVRVEGVGEVTLEDGVARAEHPDAPRLTILWEVGDLSSSLVFDGAVALLAGTESPQAVSGRWLGAAAFPQFTASKPATEFWQVETLRGRYGRSVARLANSLRRRKEGSRVHAATLKVLETAGSTGGRKLTALGVGALSAVLVPVALPGWAIAGVGAGVFAGARGIARWYLSAGKDRRAGMNDGFGVSAAAFDGWTIDLYRGTDLDGSLGAATANATFFDFGGPVLDALEPRLRSAGLSSSPTWLTSLVARVAIEQAVPDLPEGPLWQIMRVEEGQEAMMRLVMNGGPA